MAASPLRADIFITRPDGNMTPLLASDELPHRIVVEGVPRVMSPLDISGMTCVGCFGFRHRQYTLDKMYKISVKKKNVINGEPLKAKFFITRDNGGMVPALAMDEMPENFTLEGVPRTLSAFDITGMTCIGLYEARDELHTIKDVNEVTFPTESGINTLVLSSEHSQTATDTLRATPTLSTPTSNRTPSVTTAASSIDASTTNVPIKPGVKEFCSFWLRHGECDYAQQGCLYRHEMPLDQDTLRSLGLRDIPRWYREKHGLGSFLAAGGSGAGFGGSGLKSTVAIGMPQEIAKPVMAQSLRLDKAQSARPPFDRRPPRNPVKPFSNRKGGNSRVMPRHERSSSINSAIAYLKTRKQTPPESLSGKNSEAHQQEKPTEAQNTLEKRNHMLNSILHTLKLNAKLNEAKKDGFTSAGEADISGTASEGLSSATETPSTILTRRPSQVSMWSDIEADIHRRDAARKVKEDEAYKLSCEAYAAENAAKPVTEEKQATSEKLGGKDVQRANGSERRGFNGGKRGRGYHRGGNRNKKVVPR